MGLKFAMVCASNANRSMEAHRVLKENNMNVDSFGVSTKVKLPGPSIDKPNIYDFGTPYNTIYEQLKKQDENLYIRNGILQMLDRNRNIKEAPQRFQEAKDEFDVILCFEERIFEVVEEHLRLRQEQSYNSVLIINIHVKDNHEEAAKAGQEALLLCKMIEDSEDWEANIDNTISKFVEKTNRRTLYNILFY